MKILLQGSLVFMMTFVSINSLAQTEYVMAPVLESRPLYRIVEIATPQEQCQEQEIIIERQTTNQSHTPLIISTILGGAVGNAVGHGKSNQRVGAVLGAVLGHTVGRDIIRKNQSVVREYETVLHCNTVYQQHQEERLMGYEITYLYNNKEYTVETDTDPGEQIRVRVSLQPVL